MGWHAVVWRGVTTQQHRNGTMRLRVLLYEGMGASVCTVQERTGGRLLVLGWVVWCGRQRRAKWNVGWVVLGDNSSFIYLPFLTIPLLLLSNHPYLYVFLEQFCTFPYTLFVLN
uniref:Uncharacterized protein n=1 Tax=Wuchereria bancrofti TaxID=6293 RepID=A0AAF5Q350_WUCBA